MLVQIRRGELEFFCGAGVAKNMCGVAWVGLVNRGAAAAPRHRDAVAAPGRSCRTAYGRSPAAAALGRPRARRPRRACPSGGAFGAAAFQIAETLQTLSFEIEQLFILFIYAEVIGMVGAYISSSRIPLTLPIIIAITALCRLIVMQSKETEALVLISESASILLLSGAAYIMSLKGKISLEKLKELQPHDPS